MRHREVTLAGLALIAALVGGCIAGSSSSKVSGTHIGHNTVAQIEPGVTSKAWIRATLGEPTSKSTVDSAQGRTEIWRYDWSQSRKSSGWVFPFVIGSSSAEATGTAYVEFQDDVVLRAWRDVTPYQDRRRGSDDATSRASSRAGT